MQGVGEGRRFSAFNFSSFPGGDFGVQQRWNSREGGKGCAMLLASLSVCLVGLLKMNYFKSIFFFLRFLSPKMASLILICSARSQRFISESG